MGWGNWYDCFLINAWRVKIVLLNTAAFPSKDVPKRILFCRLPIIGEIFVRAFNGFAKPATWMASARGMNENASEGFLFPYRSWHDRVAIWNFVKDIPFEKNHVSRITLKQIGGIYLHFHPPHRLHAGE